MVEATSLPASVATDWPGEHLHRQAREIAGGVQDMDVRRLAGCFLLRHDQELVLHAQLVGEVVPTWLLVKTIYQVSGRWSACLAAVAPGDAILGGPTFEAWLEAAR
jgi:hypothetical protein